MENVILVLIDNFQIEEKKKFLEDGDEAIFDD